MTTPFFADSHRVVYNHDCRSMPELADNSVHCCVTSPPYWGLRKYAGKQDLIWGGDNHHEHEWDIEKISAETWHKDGHVPAFGRGEQPTRAKRPDLWQKVTHERGFCSLCGAWRGAFGLEPTPDLYIQHSIEILREIKRVLRPDGVVFWNIGDSYSGSGRGLNANGQDGGSGEKQKSNAGSIGVVSSKRIPRGSGRWGGGDISAPGLKPKDLCLIPERFALAAQSDGWWVRSRICWNKSNPMPESVQDRPTDSWEHIWMLTKSARYYYDAEAVREAQTGNAHSRGDEACNATYQEAWGSYKGFNTPAVNVPGGRNLRSVWTFPTQPFKGAHFATFPPELPMRCIKAATSEKGCCPKCGQPWVRIVERPSGPPASWNGSKFDGKRDIELHPNVGRREDAHTASAYPEGTTANRLALLRQQARANGGEYVNETKTLGWKPSCQCGAGDAVPCLVLDCFAGSGTTLQVAAELGSRSVGYEISEKYCRLIVERNKQAVLG